MAEGGEGFDEAVLIPAGVSAWAKEVGPLIVVDSVDFLAEGGKEGDDFRADEARGAGDEKLHRVELWGIGVGVGKKRFLALLLTSRKGR